jgi:DNA helicase-2/ATP-dependent DNA helicase PcrA
MSEFIDSLELNPPQREAVLKTDGPLLVLAGAGTGKTRVLTSRIAYIINSGKASANEILAVTFTNKAAKEMQHRISQILLGHSFFNAGTFHSISAKILRKYSHLIGLTPYFSIIDQDDQLKIIKNIFDDLGLDKKETNPRLVLAIIQRWKDLGIKYTQISSSDIKTQDHLLAQKIYQIYQNKLTSSNLCDFGDLLLHCTNIFFDHPEVLETLQNQYKYILIDEYQDTNAVQYLWARMLATKNKNICCVGDDDQSIYSWRGAEVANILRFEKDFRCKNYCT